MLPQSSVETGIDVANMGQADTNVLLSKVRAKKVTLRATVQHPLGMFGA